MSDRVPLLRAVVANPAEDTPRLAYADWLEEYGSPDERRHARLVRDQFARLAIGPPRRRLETGVLHPSPGGPDYFQLISDRETGLAPGDRVDVAVAPHHKHRAPRRVHPGLRVVRVEPDNGAAWVTLARDAGSVPYPAKQADDLARDIVLGLNGLAAYFSVLCWLPAGTYAVDDTLRPNSTTSSTWVLRVARGFPSELRCPYLSWASSWAGHLLGHVPLTDVEFSDPPRLGFHDDRSNRRRTYYLLDAAVRPLAPAVTWAVSDDRRQHHGDAATEQAAVENLLPASWPSVRSWRFPYQGVAVSVPGATLGGTHSNSGAGLGDGTDGQAQVE